MLVFGQEGKAFLLIGSLLWLTASRPISDFWTVFETHQEMSLMESMALHSCRPSSHAEWTVTEPVVAFAFMWCPFKIAVVTNKANVWFLGAFLRKQSGWGPRHVWEEENRAWGEVIPVISDSLWVWICLLWRQNSCCCYSLLGRLGWSIWESKMVEVGWNENVLVWADRMDLLTGIGQPCSCPCASIFCACTHIRMIHFKIIFKEKANNV